MPYDIYIYNSAMLHENHFQRDYENYPNSLLNQGIVTENYKEKGKETLMSMQLSIFQFISSQT